MVFKTSPLEIPLSSTLLSILPWISTKLLNRDMFDELQSIIKNMIEAMMFRTSLENPHND